MFKRRTHISRQEMSPTSWRTYCGRFVREERLIVKENPECQICRKLWAKWNVKR